MKHIILAFILFTTIAFSTSCSKQDKSCTAGIDTAPDAEVAALQQYLTDNKIEATKDEHGFFYTIQAAGAGSHPNGCSQIIVNYKGSLTSGKVFDQNNNIQFELKDLIQAWVGAIPLIATGGKITIYAPPSLAYGSSATGSIPANSILIFNIDLVKVL